MLKTIAILAVGFYLAQGPNLREAAGYLARACRFVINKIEPQTFSNQPQSFRQQQDLIIENARLKKLLEKPPTSNVDLTPTFMPSPITDSSIRREQEEKKCRYVGSRNKDKCLKRVAKEKYEEEWALDL